MYQHTPFTSLSCSSLLLFSFFSSAPSSSCSWAFLPGQTGCQRPLQPTSRALLSHSRSLALFISLIVHLPLPSSSHSLAWSRSHHLNLKKPQVSLFFRCLPVVQAIESEQIALFIHEILSHVHFYTQVV